MKAIMQASHRISLDQDRLIGEKVSDMTRKFSVPVFT